MKPKKLTKQEEMVTLYTQQSISGRSTFHPKQWSTGKEPAYMIVVIGRSLFFVNMTASGSYLKELAAHNIDQARSRMSEWQKGRQLRGQNEWRKFAISWDDVDYIAIISVVDGPHAGCLDHRLAEMALPAKVKICSTITSAIMFELAKRHGGGRDLLALCVWLKQSYNRLSEAVVVRWMTETREKSIVKYLDGAKQRNLGGYGPTSIPVFDYLINALTSIKRQNVETDHLSELSWDDIGFISAFCTNLMGEAIDSSSGTFAMKQSIGYHRFATVLSTSSETFRGLLPKLLEKMELDQLNFVFALHLLSKHEHMPMLFLSEKLGPSALDNDFKLIEAEAG